MNSERFVRLTLKDGSHLDFHRDDDNMVRICSDKDGHCTLLPHASGRQVLELFGLLEAVGDVVIEEDENG
jgi:hypothetical protein